MYTLIFAGLSLLLVVTLLLITRARKRQASTGTMKRPKKAVISHHEEIVFEKNSQRTRISPSITSHEMEMLLHNTIMSFTQTQQKTKNQLPLIGLPDKSLYHIH